MTDIPSLFGSMAFDDAAMRARLPRDVYKALKRAATTGANLELQVANVVASAMKDWAVENGATHFTHWFQPMTGITAEKHDSFIMPAEGGKAIMEFSGKELVRGESDASSFPSGGLRSTFEARGYTVWDITSYAFVKDETLCIPTAFCSYSGEALDKKTPLLRSMEVLDKQAIRILRLFGNTEVKRVMATVGPEQEYFLIDKSVFLRRPDLIYTGRTLFGARPPKGQELDDHYFGSLKPRVSAFMKELEHELWKLGVLAKTRHNEAAPAQHEFAPVFTTVNIATDHNQLTMELMQRVANKHGMACLLHEKPFAGVNGSGKHVNWSLSTNTGVNLLEPGETPAENAQFLLFLAATLKAVDDYQDLLRVSVATAGNDHRLGANEAPPAIVSVFLGDELTEILKTLENGMDYHGSSVKQMEIGVTSLPNFPKDTTDRNRTSPIAFTGNKFEFRMPGSMLSIAGPCFVLNTAVADILRGFADRLEKSADFKRDLAQTIKKAIRDHKRIIFNGNSYSDEWLVEAERRGLTNLRNAIEALPLFVSKKSIDFFERNHVLSEAEIHSRYEILLENYCKTVNIEAFTLIDIVKKAVIPACISYENELCELICHKKSCDMPKGGPEEYLLEKISRLSSSLLEKLNSLETTVIGSKAGREKLDQAKFYRDEVASRMDLLRPVIDELETLVAKKHWNMPTYSEILYSV